MVAMIEVSRFQKSKKQTAARCRAAVFSRANYAAFAAASNRHNLI